MYFASQFTLILYLKPLINTTISTNTRYFYINFSDSIIISDILVPDGDFKQVTDILDIELKTFAP